ncbi:MAG TPA: ABC transporter permease [Porphyromonadaceae bacterium]|jgi:putative ABC transport system permease protein|nr:ABC transporter permease [Porphyromonadaceae bacterium]
MLQQYFKQAWRLLKENPVLSAISIIGTALAICMIMVMVMSHQVKNAPYPPETNRDRMLYVKWMSSREKGSPNSGSSNGPMSYAFAKTCFKTLKTAEAVAIVSPFTPSAIASIPGQIFAESYDKMLTDEDFWRVFDFSFIDGKPYTKEDVDAGLRKVVISEKTALKTFGTTAVSGQRILIDYTEFIVNGVVKDVSPVATAAYSQIWAPITTTVLPDGGEEGIQGVCRVYILAKSKKDFSAIKEEAEVLRKRYNDATTTYEAFYRKQPDTHFVYIHRKWANMEPDMKAIVQQSAIVLVLLLIVPAINLSGMMNSRMRKRLSELGVRRAFGATRGNLLSQVMWESLLQTLLGGMVGLILSYIAAYALKGIIYENSDMAYQLGEVTLNPASLLSPAIFLYAFLFCLLLNVLSAFIPARSVSHKPIVDSIHSK